MKHKSFEDMNCSLAQTLEIIGERWTLLILRDAFFGIRRFDQFQSNLGIARNILTTRLKKLVEQGILHKTKAEGDSRFEYRLSEKGLDLQPILLAITHWGDKYIPHPNGDRLIFVERETRQPIQKMAVHAADGRQLKPKEIKAVPGSGYDANA